MKIWVIALVVFCVVIGIIIIAFNIPNYAGLNEFDIVKNVTFYANEGEPCKGYDTNIPCKEGYKCILASTEPYENGICMKENTTLEEDFTNRNNYMDKNITQN